MTPVILDGSKPLWDSLEQYVEWITAHTDEIYDAYVAGDENAELIVYGAVVVADGGDAKDRTIFKIAVERFISQHYPEIARIEAKGKHMTDLSEREKIIRESLRREKRERWRFIEKTIQGGLTAWYLEWWREHWPIDKHDMNYMIGRDSQHGRRHVRIELHYVRQSKDRQFQLETMFAGVGKEST